MNEGNTYNKYPTSWNVRLKNIESIGSVIYQPNLFWLRQ